jgi:peptidoglycan/LPS O-acetylase OafA/YrhL
LRVQAHRADRYAAEFRRADARDGTVPQDRRDEPPRPVSPDPAANTNRAFLPALTGLRGAAALWVLALHASQLLPVDAWPIVQHGWMGVDVFFVLSGFILGHVYLKDFRSFGLPTTGRFMLQRLARIYPVHITMLFAATAFAVALYFVGADVLDHPRYQPGLFVANLFMVQAWGWSDYPGFNTVAWSISAEFLAYLAFPVLAVIANRLTARTALLVAAAVLIADVAILDAVGDTLVHPTLTAPIRVAGEFTCGVFLYSVYRQGRWAGLHWGTITTVATVAFLAAASLSGSFVAVLFVPFIVIGLAYGKGPVGRFLALPAMIYLGEVSYSLYMVHRFVIETVFAPIDLTHLAASVTLGARVAVLAGALVVVAAATVLMHRYIEVPARAWMRGGLERAARRTSSFVRARLRPA